MSRSWMQVAADQGGWIRTEQLRAHGVAKRRLATLVGQGILEPDRHRAVYRVGAVPLDDIAFLWRAVVTIGGTLVGTSAGFVWQVLPALQLPITVAVQPSAAHRPLPRNTRLRVGDIPMSARTTRLGLPVTTRAVTVVDLCGSLPYSRAVTLADRAVQQHWVTIDTFQRRLSTPKQKGNTQLRRVVDVLDRGIASEAERQFQQLMRAGGISGWRANVTVFLGGRKYILDVAFLHLRLAIEVDGYEYHRAEEVFQRDRDRQNALVNAGWRVLRFTWSAIVDHPERVLGQVRAALG